MNSVSTESFLLNLSSLYSLEPITLKFKVNTCLLWSNFRKNGFVLEEDPDAPPGHQFKLKAVPFSKNITFGVEGSLWFCFPWFLNGVLIYWASIMLKLSLLLGWTPAYWLTGILRGNGNFIFSLLVEPTYDVKKEGKYNWVCHCALLCFAYIVGEHSD